MAIAAENRAAAIAKLQEELNTRLAPYRTPLIADPRSIQSSQVSTTLMAADVETRAVTIAKLQEEMTNRLAKFHARMEKLEGPQFTTSHNILELPQRIDVAAESLNKKIDVFAETLGRKIDLVVENLTQQLNQVVERLECSNRDKHSGEKLSPSLLCSVGNGKMPGMLMENEYFVETGKTNVFDEMSDLKFDDDFVENGEVVVSDDGQLMSYELPIIKEVSESDEVSEGFELDDFSEKLQYGSEKVLELSIRNEVTKFGELDEFSDDLGWDQFTKKLENVRNAYNMGEFDELMFELGGEENDVLKLPVRKELFEIAEIINCGDKKVAVETLIKVEIETGKKIDFHELLGLIRGTAICETHRLCYQVHHSARENHWYVKDHMALSSSAPGIFCIFDSKRHLSNSSLLSALSVLEDSNHVRDELLEMLLPLPEPPPGIYSRFIKLLTLEDSLIRSHILSTVDKMFEKKFEVMLRHYSRMKMLTYAWLKMLYQPPDFISIDETIKDVSSLNEEHRVALQLRAALLSELHVPEIKKMQIEELCLEVKLTNPNFKIEDFLHELSTQPVYETIRDAIVTHSNIGALSHYEKLVELGRKLGFLSAHPLSNKEAHLVCPDSKIDSTILVGCGSVPTKVWDNDWCYFTGQVLIKSICSVDSVEEVLSTLLLMFQDVRYLRFNPIDERCAVELDETDPILWLESAGAAQFSQEMGVKLGIVVSFIQCGRAKVILEILGINNLLNFGFLDLPPSESLLKILEMLIASGALIKHGEIIKDDRRMVELPYFSRRWCFENHFQVKGTKDVRDIRDQLEGILEMVAFGPNIIAKEKVNFLVLVVIQEFQPPGLPACLRDGFMAANFKSIQDFTTKVLYDVAAMNFGDPWGQGSLLGGSNVMARIISSMGKEMKMSFIICINEYSMEMKESVLLLRPLQMKDLVWAWALANEKVIKNMKKAQLMKKPIILCLLFSIIKPVKRVLKNEGRIYRIS